MRIRAISRLPSGPSNKHSSTLAAFCEKSEKFTPLPSQVAPSGYGCPSHTFILAYAFYGFVTLSEAKGLVFAEKRDSSPSAQNDIALKGAPLNTTQHPPTERKSHRSPKV